MEIERDVLGDYPSEVSCEEYSTFAGVPQGNRHGTHIGAALVDEGSKHLMGAPCRSTGMRSIKHGPQAILPLRCLLLKARSDEYSPPLKAGVQNPLSRQSKLAPGTYVTAITWCPTVLAPTTTAACWTSSASTPPIDVGH